ncbi:hypothetical protein HNV11_16555 [Spirosoma taeanense]|uniref:Uncharacterized protein n=1 Tax=Spirosoma taeanense TaxID=2735870 RepID=A0A6M5YC62_9BACT|nr:hypothetical protein [Spirosoma taeanense]QJW90873.1 hypothetical protein HNV11_16555 [Spirosoma taeanense]
MKVLVLLGVLLSSVAARAQYNPVGAITMWTDGYVVTMQNDTVSGQVRVGSFINDSPAGVVIRLPDDKKVKLKGDDLRLIAQRIPGFAYSTGSIPREREWVIFERVPNPRRNGKPMLLERLTPDGGRIALYFDVSGWKKTTEYSFGNFSISKRQDLSYIVLKNGSESLIAKRGDLETVHERLFGDCPSFIRNYPVAKRRDWEVFGAMVDTYNQLCQQQ